jgi:hypothetical protein
MSIHQFRRGKFTLGLVTGALVALAFAWQQQIKEREGCEPVVDVQYKRVGKKSYLPETVIRQPMREGDRCVLAEAAG